jgi:hypothetical protein
LTTLLHRGQLVSAGAGVGPKNRRSPALRSRLSDGAAAPRRWHFRRRRRRGDTLCNFDPDLVTVEVATFIEWAPADKGHLAVTTDL